MLEWLKNILTPPPEPSPEVNQGDEIHLHLDNPDGTREAIFIWEVDRPYTSVWDARMAARTFSRRSVSTYV